VDGVESLPGDFLECADLRFEDDEFLNARRVVVAVGVAPFAYLPDALAGLPSALVSHSSEHHALDKFAGRDVAVVGAGASAIDVAALLHAAGGNAMLVARRPRLAFHEAPVNPHGRRPLTQRIRWPRSGIGNGWKSYLCAGLPFAFRHLPESLRLEVVRTHLGPAPCWFTKGEVVGKVDMRLGRSLERATPDGDRVRLHLQGADGRKEELLVDHVIAGTGYRPDLRRLAFVPEELREDIALIGDAPALSGNFESSVAGLYFVGPIAANSFGPLARFAFGARFAAHRVLRHFPPHPAKAGRLVMAAAD
jgi:thioredoxin reductase